MAKLNKIMPPRNTTIRGNDHLLAYITPEEAQLLMDNGGSGEPGPMGIPSFNPNEDRNREEAAAAAENNSDRGKDGGMSQSEIDAAINDAMADLGPNVSEYGIATDDLGSNLFGGDYYPDGTEYGQPNYKAVTDVWNQINKAKQYEQPLAASIMSLFHPLASIEKVQSLASQFTGPRFINALAVAGNTPINSGGRVTGVRDKYGNVLEGRDPNAPDQGGRDGGPEPEIKPVNPETGQCDEGYMFDEDMQACRLDTGYQAAASTGGAFGAPGDQYARMGLLDVAPTGLPQFQQRYGAGFGSPTDFAAANTAFRRRGAYEPANFQNPYPTTGYTLLS
jgi:hypothetical protein